jgi:hypothetical protein
MPLVASRLPTWALQQVGSYLEYAGRNADIVAEAARDPLLTWLCSMDQTRVQALVPITAFLGDNKEIAFRAGG